MAINKINKDEIIRCTPEEDAIINAQIAADPGRFRVDRRAFLQLRDPPGVAGPTPGTRK